MPSVIEQQHASAPVRRPGRMPPATTPNRRRKRGPGQSSWWALIFVGPTALGLLVFYLWPTVRTVFISLTNTGPFGGSEFIGLQNYRDLLQDPEFFVALRNTAVYTLIALIGVPISISIAALLNTAGLRGKSVYRAVYFLPVVTMPVAVGMVWRLVYNGDFGILNQALRALGLAGNSWLTDPSTALIAVAVVGIWATLGTNIVIFLAGLQSIPSTVLEAADLDGAGPIRKFFSVTVPLLSPSIFFVCVISIIGSFQVFDLIYLMLGPTNPATRTSHTIVYLFYEAGFLDHERGYAAAVAIVLLLTIVALTVFQFRLQKRWVHYG